MKNLSQISVILMKHLSHFGHLRLAGMDLGIVRTFPTVGGGVGLRGQHVKVTNLSASPPLNWSRDGAIAIDAERLFHWSTVRGKKLNL